MARLIGVGVFIWSLYASMSYAWGHAPQPASLDETAATASAIGGPSFAEVEVPASSQSAVLAASPADIVDELLKAKQAESAAPAVLSFDSSLRGRSTVTQWMSGTYSIGADPNPRIAARDRDIKPRHPLFEDDERLESLSVPAYMRTIQGELEPGLYSTDGITSECSYQLWRVMKRSRETKVIGEENLSGGRLLVTIDGFEPDWFTASAGCGRWQRWTPRTDPTAPIGNGDYGPGDLAPGRWQVPDGCLWEQVVAFRGASLRDVVASGRGPAVLEIDDSGLGLRLRICRGNATFDPAGLADNRQ